MIRCERCGEDFARKDNLTRHRNRRYPCQPKDEGSSNYCQPNGNNNQPESSGSTFRETLQERKEMLDESIPTNYHREVAKPDRVEESGEIKGTFLSPEESITWREIYKDGADPYQVLEEVRKIASKVPVEASHLQPVAPQKNPKDTQQQMEVQDEVPKSASREYMTVYDLDIPTDKGLTDIELED